MKVSIKEFKVEEDGCEILYIKDFGFILKSETFSGPLKQCLEKRADKRETGTKNEEGIVEIIPYLNQIISQFSAQTGAGAEDKPQQKKEPAVENKS